MKVLSRWTIKSSIVIMLGSQDYPSCQGKYRAHHLMGLNISNQKKMLLITLISFSEFGSVIDSEICCHRYNHHTLMSRGDFAIHTRSKVSLLDLVFVVKYKVPIVNLD